MARKRARERQILTAQGGCRPAWQTPSALNTFSPIEDAIVLFLADLKQRGRAASTLNAYRSDLGQFALFVHPRADQASVGAIPSELVREFIADQTERRSVATVRRKLIAVRSLFLFVRSIGARVDDPTLGLQVEKDLGASAPVLGPGEIKRALEDTEGRGFIYARDVAIVELLYGSGLRLAELVALNLTSLDLPTGRIEIGDSRLVPIGSRAIVSVQEYLLYRADHLVDKNIAKVDAGALFLNANGRRLHRRTIQRIVEEFLEKSNIAGKHGPQALRRACAAHMLDAGASTQVVANLFGQKSVGVAAVSSDEVGIVARLQATYASSHPRACVKKRTL